MRARSPYRMQHAWKQTARAIDLPALSTETMSQLQCTRVYRDRTSRKCTGTQRQNHAAQHSVRHTPHVCLPRTHKRAWLAATRTTTCARAHKTKNAVVTRDPQSSPPETKLREGQEQTTEHTKKSPKPPRQAGRIALILDPSCTASGTYGVRCLGLCGGSRRLPSATHKEAPEQHTACTHHAQRANCQWTSSCPQTCIACLQPRIVPT